MGWLARHCGRQPRRHEPARCWRMLSPLAVCSSSAAGPGLHLCITERDPNNDIKTEFQHGMQFLNARIRNAIAACANRRPISKGQPASCRSRGSNLADQTLQVQRVLLQLEG